MKVLAFVEKDDTVIDKSQRTLQAGRANPFRVGEFFVQAADEVCIKVTINQEFSMNIKQESWVESSRRYELFQLSPLHTST